MSQRTRITQTLIFLATSIVTIWSGPEFSRAQDLVVLRNGNVISGNAILSRDHATVEMVNGSKSIINLDQIGTICGTFEEAFEFVSKDIPADDFDEQLKLFRWCLKFEQLDLAERQFNRLSLTKVAPDQLLTIHRQLEMARESASRKTSPLAFEQQIVETNMISDDSVTSVSYEESSDSIPNTLPKYELEKVLEPIPNFCKMSFRRQIEPMLTRNCANAGCHHQRESVMPLFATSNGVPLPRLMSQQNLVQVLRRVDPERPASESDLVHFAATAHGTQELPTFARDSAEYQTILQWVTMMQEPVADSGLSLAKKLEPSGIETKGIEASTDTVPSIPKSFVPGQNRAPKLAPESPTSPIPSIPELHAPSKTERSNDPFDPNVFNRMHHGRSK
ncbi:MAG: hypothetical protein R3C03_20665 [Pirellulaceae bacterium]